MNIKTTKTSSELSTIDVLETRDVDYILNYWRPGSGEWDWKTEALTLFDGTDNLIYMHELLTRVNSDGIGFADAINPITLGNDGRVWDGHHRLILAKYLNINNVKVSII